MSAQVLEAWSCPTCTSRELKSRVQEGAGSRETVGLAGSDYEPSLSDVMAKLDTVLQRLNALERNQEEKLAIHQATNDTIARQTETIQNMEACLEMLSSKYDDLIRSLEGQKEEIKGLKKKTNDFGAEFAAPNARISHLEKEVDRLEQYSCKYNIEIHGIKPTSGEALRSVLGLLASKLKLSVPSSEEVEAVHRIKCRPNVVPPILVRLIKFETREKWLEQRTCLKEEKIYVNENLTALTKNLLWLTKKKATENHYRFVWVRNERVYVRKQEGASLIRLIAKQTWLK